MSDSLVPPIKKSILWDPDYDEEYEKYALALAAQANLEPEPPAAAAQSTPESPDFRRPTSPAAGKADARIRSITPEDQRSEPLFLSSGDPAPRSKFGAEKDKIVSTHDEKTMYAGFLPDLSRVVPRPGKERELLQPAPVDVNRAEQKTAGPVTYERVDARRLSPAGVDAAGSKGALEFDLGDGRYAAGITIVNEDRTVAGAVLDSFNRPFDIKIKITVETAEGSYSRNGRFTEPVPPGGLVSVPLKELGLLQGPGRVKIEVENVGAYRAGVIVGANPEHGRRGGKP